jgi:hypothetical protein
MLSKRRVFLLAIPILLAVCAVAQTQPGRIVQIGVQVPKPGAAAQYEAGRKKHMDFHKQQNDAWAWHTWQVTTGEGAGTYVTGSFSHQWKDFDGREKFQEADGTDFDTNIAPSLAKSETSYWTFRPDLSRLKTEGDFDAPMLTVIHFYLNPEGGPTFVDAVKRVNQGIDKAKYPAPPSRWYQLVNGGEGPHFVLVAPRANWAAMGVPEKTIDDAMTDAYGKVEGAALMSTLRKSARRIYTELLEHRADLSYMPGK